MNNIFRIFFFVSLLGSFGTSSLMFATMNTFTNKLYILTLYLINIFSTGLLAIISTDELFYKFTKKKESYTNKEIIKMIEKAPDVDYVGEYIKTKLTTTKD